MDFKDILRNSYNSIKNSLKFHIIMDIDKYELIIDKNKLDGINYGIDFIKLLLNQYYNNLERLYRKNSENVVVYLKKDFCNDYFLKQIDTTLNFIKTLDLLYEKNLLNSSEILKYRKLKKLIDYKIYFKNIFREKYIYYYKQEKKSFDVNLILRILKLENEKFIKVIEKVNNRDEFFILMKSFIKMNVEKNYYITDNNIRINQSYFLNITDNYDIYNKIELRKKPSYLSKVILNKDLEENITSCLSKDFNKLEKAIYIYIKLCQVLTHDEKDVDKMYLTINHSDIDRISMINEENNIVVCYEFVAIFAKFLDQLGIKYEIIGCNKYANGHCSLNVLYNNILLKFDATLGLFDCDLTKIKNKIRACGVNIIKSNPNDELEFNNSLEKVYRYLEVSDNIKYEYENELVNKYREEIEKVNDINLEKKKKIFFDKIKSCSLPPIDTIKYIKLIKKIIFDKDEKVEYEIIVNKDTEKGLTVSCVFCFYNPTLNENEYYLYNYQNSIKNITKEELKYNFENNIFDYIEYTTKKKRKVINY